MAGDYRPTIFGVCIALPIIAIVAVAFRISSRWIKKISLGADDWTIIASLIFSIGLSIDVLICSRLGNLGGHTKFTPQGIPLLNEDFVIFGKTIFALEILSWPAIGLTKISVLFLYARIFVGPRFRTLCWVSIGFVVAWTVTFTVALIFSCWPIESHWNPEIPSKCVDQISLFTAGLSTDVITDGIILLYPIYNITKLHMPVRRKVAVSFIFLLGGFTTVMGGIRLHYLIEGYKAFQTPLFDDIDYLYAPPFFWSVIESNVGIVSACLPTIRPVLDALHIDEAFVRLVSVLTSPVRSRSHSHQSTANIRLGSVDKASLKKQGPADAYIYIGNAPGHSNGEVSNTQRDYLETNSTG